LEETISANFLNPDFFETLSDRRRSIQTPHYAWRIQEIRSRGCGDPMVDLKQDRLAKEVVELSISFKMALSDKRKYPMAEFKSFVAAAKRYTEALGKDPLIHRDVVSAAGTISLQMANSLL
jgi:hypothetical protein